MKVTLCGSARFENKFHYWNEKLTLQGHIIYSLSTFPSFKNNKHTWYTPEQKIILDKVHKLKIDNSDAIFVINTQDRYIGDSTLSEITHAFNNNKLIYFEWWPTDVQIHQFYPYGNGVFDLGTSLFKGICKFERCENILEGGVCAVCYD